MDYLDGRLAQMWQEINKVDVPISEHNKGQMSEDIVGAEYEAMAAVLPLLEKFQDLGRDELVMRVEQQSSYERKIEHRLFEAARKYSAEAIDQYHAGNAKHAARFIQVMQAFSYLRSGQSNGPMVIGNRTFQMFDPFTEEQVQAINGQGGIDMMYNSDCKDCLAAKMIFKAFGVDYREHTFIPKNFRERGKVQIDGYDHGDGSFRSLTERKCNLPTFVVGLGVREPPKVMTTYQEIADYAKLPSIAV